MYVFHGRDMCPRRKANDHVSVTFLLSHVRLFLRIQVRASSQTKGRERGWKQRARLWRDGFFLSPHTPYRRVRLARFARVRLLRHALPISLLILRKKPTVLQSIVFVTFPVTFFFLFFLTHVKDRMINVSESLPLRPIKVDNGKFYLLLRSGYFVNGCVFTRVYVICKICEKLRRIPTAVDIC